jgi:L-serine/L-threonine ammonia-lyase
MPLHIETPLFQSRELSEAANKNVWLKFEALQPTGSFKLRGIGAACEAYQRQGKTKFVSSSGGNAGLAAAYAGRILGVPVTVVIPQSTPARMKAILEQEGATVIVHGAVWSEANQFAQGLLDDDTAFLHPFDDPLVWAGHASLIDEVVRAGVNFDAVITSVGGGGLFAGIAEGLERNGMSDTPIIAVETKGADCLSQAMLAGVNRPLHEITSVAKSLGANMACERAFSIAQTRDVRSVVVSDYEALDACEQFLRDHRVLVEPACGAALAVLYSQKHQESLDAVRSPLIVVCGGVTATLDMIREWKAATERT